MSELYNLYLTDPRITELQTKIEVVEESEAGGLIVSCSQNIFRSEGGGQPADHGSVEIHGNAYHVAAIQKRGGRVYLYLPNAVRITQGVEATQLIDRHRREKLSRLHTLQHIFSSQSQRLLPFLQPRLTRIKDDASSVELRFHSAEVVDQAITLQLDSAIRSVVKSQAVVTYLKEKSTDDARRRFGSIFRLDPAVTLSGKVRIVLIDTVDANCCSGTHSENSDVGEYSTNLIQTKRAEFYETIFLLSLGSGLIV